ncbi:hypothetical protein [Pseudomonas sp.]|uniref:hypothetical protein n=1 Tax=Pseudomonas sp. TaxID=306 RepID=UPI00260CC2C6|nr:hypothetical protein [Pseudomonas sp.]
MSMMMLLPPSDPVILAEVGKISLMHGHLDYMLKMLIVTFTGASHQEVLDATKYEGSRSLRERIKKIAKSKLGDGKVLIQLQALLERCARSSDKRNDLVHSLWAYELDGQHHVQAADHTWKPGPTIDDLKEVCAELEGLIQEIIFARAEGLFSEAVLKKDVLLKV